MKNLKKPARLPRKAPSNQTGGTAWGKKLAAEISRMAQAADMKKLILLNFPYIIAFYMVEKAAWLYRHCNGDSVVDRLMVLFMNFGLAYKSVLPSFHPFDLMVGLVGAAALKAVIYFKGKNAKKYRQGEEYGSARWGNQKDIEPFIDPVFENNVILTQTERLMMSGRPKHPKYARNKNVIVIGGSGSGKTRFYVKPNLMQMPQKVSYVVTDPKGTIIIECGKMLSDAGYKIKVLNTINFKKSMPYVWGGSSPSTSFDCSGFVCWVINNCGNGWNVGRTTANGLRGKCSYVSPGDAKPGDLIFFEKTYNTTGASHVGIYVGDGMMIHCGDPISYASINSNYWKSHFLGFGRIN